MRRARLVTRVVKPALWIVALGPLVWLVQAAYTENLGAEPVETIQRVTGLSTLISLMVTLAVTPLRRLSGWNELIRTRRPIGLFAFFYASLHAFSYFVFDQALSPGDIAADVAEHPWVTVGFTSWLVLIPLAVTSTNGWIRRLGGRRWNRLHRLVYVAAAGGVLHFLWLVKRDLTQPLVFGAVLAGLFLIRLRVAFMKKASPRLRPPRLSPDEVGS